ncbi:HD-GYP domain-containing protein [Bacillus rubiinfantis]|uniref:HD-GYP domain-containing protein n=1 Tax=Bacillus rubiinfantis TaxID=1499680 RepID=UPI0005A988EB|nr:HD-GYP domain-containing protein [Bacillus rubiinfantis]
MIPVEEKRTIKWFLLFFYIIFIASDIFYYYILPKYIFHDEVGLPSNFWYFNYLVLIILLPVSVFFNRHNKQNSIKYVLFISYLFVATVVDLVTFWGRGDSYTSGNTVELFLILTLPLFLSTGYFWLISIGIAVKYTVIGLVLHTSYVIMPILLLVILSIMSFFLLVRFQGYVKAISNNYDNQLQGIVKGVIAALELKDPYTRGHSERVANYALLLAKKMGILAKDEQKSFYNVCLLHDIGKVHIPDSILMKPSKLSKEEFEIIKTHPVVGAEAVQDVEGLKENICVIRSHHERWDGKGYPDGLKGEEIPLLARIAAIADAFDAMTSSRSYRSALPLEEAFNRIVEGAGSQFDPRLVDEFKKVYPAWVNFHRKYSWAEENLLIKEVKL